MVSDDEENCKKNASETVGSDCETQSFQRGPHHPVTDIHLGSVLTNVSVPNGGWFKYFIQYSRSLYIWYKHTGNVRLQVFFFRVF